MKPLNRLERVPPPSLPNFSLTARANLVALAAALAWGLGNVSQKTILDHLDGFSATGLTCLLGALVILPFARRGANWQGKAPAHQIALGLKVSICFTIGVTLQQFGYGHTTVTNAGFLVNTSAVMTPILALALYRERQPIWIWPASLVTLAGVFLLAGGAMSELTQGDALCLLSALFFSWWTLLVGKYVIQYRKPLELTFFQLLSCGLATLAMGAIVYGLPKIAAVIAAIPELLVIGVLAKGVAYALNAIAQQRISATCAAVIVSAEAVFGAFFAMLLLGESLSLERAIGAALIMLGVMMVSCLSIQSAAAERRETEPTPVLAQGTVSLPVIYENRTVRPAGPARANIPVESARGAVQAANGGAWGRNDTALPDRAPRFLPHVGHVVQQGGGFPEPQDQVPPRPARPQPVL